MSFTCLSAEDLTIEDWYGKKFANGSLAAVWVGSEIEDLESGRFGSSFQVRCNAQSLTCGYSINYGGCEDGKTYPALFVSKQHQATIKLACEVNDASNLKVGFLHINKKGASLIEDSSGFFEIAFRSRDDPERQLIKIAIANTKGLKQIRDFLLE